MSLMEAAVYPARKEKDGGIQKKDYVVSPVIKHGLTVKVVLARKKHTQYYWK